MTEPFLISDDQLRKLSATKQGRVSIAGYNYQAAYAVARLTAMAVRQPLLNFADWPLRLRYDWGEDLDEACQDNLVRFTQCKRVAAIGQPAALAEVLTGFAPKWLWTPETERDRLRFRLVCSDSRFAVDGALSEGVKNDVHSHFLTRLNAPAGAQSDRAVWLADATAFGFDALFEALWNRFECFYLPAEIADTEPAGPRLAAEKEALRVLLERNHIDAAQQSLVLGRLRRLVHDNLIGFDPANESQLPSFNRAPRLLERADISAAIEPYRSATHRPPPFRLVDRTFLSEQRELERQQYIARQPDWCDVIHGHDSVIKFIERDQTAGLEAGVLEKVVARIGRASKLPTLFVAGAPGDGKTTITRRVAARLVEAGKLLIADAGLGLQEPPGEPDEYVQAIERLQSFGRPIVLLLDDPLYSESAWFEVLKKLNRPGLQLGVLAASPQFLLDEHKALLRACELTTFEMARTSLAERQALAALYGHTPSAQTEEDFLIVAMETAAGVSFHQIIERLWLTLADGRDLSAARSLADLPWQIRAYLFVCFFARAYEACPEPLLLKLLELTGGVPGVSDVRPELERLKHFAGWRIFRISQRARASWNFMGALISAAHTVIARQAWQQRPLPWCDADHEVIEASVSIPQTIRDVAMLAARLASVSLGRAKPELGCDEFAQKLIEQWRVESDIETRYVCDLVSMLRTGGRTDLARPMQEVLVKRAQPDAQGWLAALQLWFLSNDAEKLRKFPAEISLLPLIQAADFSVAPTRAIKFGQRLAGDKRLRDAFIARLLEAFDEKLPWKWSSHLLAYLLTIAAREQLTPRVSQISAWLAMHDEDTSVRTQYLTFLLQLPSEFDALRAEAARQTADWLAKHDEDTFTRANYLTFLLKLPSAFDVLRAEAARQTAAWLAKHDEDTSVRTQFHRFLSSIPVSQVTADQTIPVSEWQQLVVATLRKTAEFISRTGYQRRHATLVSSLFALHRALFDSMNRADTEIEHVLRLTHDVAGEWCARNPSAGVTAYLPLPYEI